MNYIWFINKIIKGTGNRLPNIAKGIAIQGESPAPVAIGIAPRSSITGTIEIKNVVIIFPATVLNKKLIIFSYL